MSKVIKRRVRQTVVVETSDGGRKVYVFWVMLAAAAVSVAAGAYQGYQQKKAISKQSKAQIADNTAQAESERVAAAREIRDETRNTEQQLSRVAAMAAANGSSLTDVGFQNLATRILRESLVRTTRISQDSGVAVTSLLRRSDAVAKASKDAQKSAIWGGLLGAGGTALSIYGASSGGGAASGATGAAGGSASAAAGAS